MFNHFARHEQAFADWRRDGYPAVRAETYQYIGFLGDPADDQGPREGTLWVHQWEAFLRVIFSYEILVKTGIGGKGLLLNVVTGGGKTAAIIAWLRVARPQGARDGARRSVTRSRNPATGTSYGGAGGVKFSSMIA